MDRFLMYFGDSQDDVLMVYRWGIKGRGIEDNDYYTHYIQLPTLDYIKTDITRICQNQIQGN